MSMNNCTREADAANNLANAINSMSFDVDAFCTAMTHQHRTLQQTFTRLCIAWLYTCASEDYRTDARNEASHSVSVKAVTALADDDFYLPYI